MEIERQAAGSGTGEGVIEGSESGREISEINAGIVEVEAIGRYRGQLGIERAIEISAVGLRLGGGELQVAASYFQFTLQMADDERRHGELVQCDLTLRAQIFRGRHSWATWNSRTAACDRESFRASADSASDPGR